MSGLTRVLKTSGGRCSFSAHRLMRLAASVAFSIPSIKGIRTGVNLTCSNCDRTACEKVSAVMPVLSETMKTVCSMGVDVMRGEGGRMGGETSTIEPCAAFWPPSLFGQSIDCRSHLPAVCALAKQAFFYSVKGDFMSYVVSFEQLRMTDVDSVGGKNASLGEMISQLAGAGVRVPGGFATTADAFREFLKSTGLDERIAQRLSTLNPDDVRELAEAGSQIRQWIVETPFPEALEKAIREAFAKLDADGKGSFAVRSSATAEDLPDASFAGQQETFLNVV